MLIPMGYSRLRHFSGGMSEWLKSGGAIESDGALSPEAELWVAEQRRTGKPASALRSDPASDPVPVMPPGTRALRPALGAEKAGRALALLDTIAVMPVGRLFKVWTLMVVAYGLAFWLVPRYGYVMEGALLSLYYLISVSLIVWRGLSELSLQEARGPLPVPATTK